MRISVNQAMERRIGLFPAGIDEDGLLYCNQNFADYPIRLPEGRFDARTPKPDFMLLSYKKQATASSCLAGHPAELALNEDMRSWWCAESGAGEWYQLDLGKVYRVHSLQLNFADEGVPVLKQPKADCSHSISTGFRWTDSGNTLRTQYLVEYGTDGEHWQTLADRRTAETNNGHPYLPFPADASTRYLRVTAAKLPYDSRFALSGVRVFGLDDGPTANGYLMQLQSDISNVAVLASRTEEMAAMGAGFAAGLASGLYGNEVFQTLRYTAYTPRMAESERARRIAGWKDAVRMALTH